MCVLLGRYAVFGLGSSMYPQFCAFAHDIDQKLSHLGASQLAPTGEGDELSGQEDAFRSWAVQTFRVRQALMSLCQTHLGLVSWVSWPLLGVGRGYGPGISGQSCFPNPHPTKKNVTLVFCFRWEVIAVQLRP
jgi:hypothetical protein